jgi:nucleotide-binding universal stress UspA family protein
MFKTILVAVDGSEHSDRAVDYAASLASNYDAELIVLHVVPTLGSARVPPELSELAHAEHVELTEVDVLKGAADQILQTAEARARGQGAKRIRTSMGIGQIAQTIVWHAKEEGTDLLVMGRRGLGSVRGLMLGSTTQKVMHLSECACLTVV